MRNSQWAFRPENFNRSSEEIKALVDLFQKKFKVKANDRISKYRVRVRAMPKRVRAAIKKAERATQEYEGYILKIAVGYWSKGRLTAAMRKVYEQVECGELKPADI